MTDIPADILYLTKRVLYRMGADPENRNAQLAIAEGLLAERRRTLAILDYHIARASNRLVDAGSNAVLREIRAKVESGEPAP